ncbi:MAG TPA: Tim44-like domain-containing protein [Casimicrobiaceae bacterium]|nr:Tim44-like domain-containing protein [Casimicrobiaceae bacterium]
MRNLKAVVFAAAAVLAMIHVDVADAARLGGGRSLGMQRSVAPPATRSAPSTGSTMSGPAANPVLPATPGAAAARSATAAAPAATAATRAGASRWLGPIAGLAAGLGLATLFSHLGLSEGLGSLLLIGLLVVGAIALVRAFAGRRPAPAAAYRHAGAGDATAAARSGIAPSTAAAIPPAWGAGPAGGPAGRYPPGFEPAPFVAQAKEQFRRLQAAYDRGDAALLADVTTPAMLADIRDELASRATQVPTEVVTLDAEVLEVQREGAQYVASLRFHGSLREDGAAVPQAFDEVWNLVKPVDGSSGWLLAGIQQYA